MRLCELFEGIKVYHGSRSNHSRFTIGHTGHNSHTFGDYDAKRYGVFFTNNPKVAAVYGDVDVYDLSLTPKEIADLDNRDLQMDFIESVSEDANLWQDAKHIRETWQFLDGDVGEAFYKFLVSKKYKAGKFVEYINDENGKELKSNTYVLFDLHRVRRNPDKNQPDLFLK